MSPEDAPDRPGAAFAALEASLRREVGFRLFTVLALDLDRGVSRRLHSSDPAAYPVAGEKPLRPGSEHYERVVREGLPRLVRDRAGIVRGFPDHALILALGCESAVNVPVRWDGRTIGALNLLDRAGAYSEARFPALLRHAALAAAPLLRATGRGGGG